MDFLPPESPQGRVFDRFAQGFKRTDSPNCLEIELHFMCLMTSPKLVYNDEQTMSLYF